MSLSPPTLFIAVVYSKNKTLLTKSVYVYNYTIPSINSRFLDTLAVAIGHVLNVPAMIERHHKVPQGKASADTQNKLNHKLG